MARLAIEDVIGEYVPLKHMGRSWKGLSPFTSEKTPSFVVSPEKQIWKDFSSGKGGSLFDFVMEMEGLDFKGALELLARKAGVDLEQYRSSQGKKGPDKERLYGLLDLSAKFYQVQLSKQQKALEYVRTARLFSKETLITWRLGYAPDTGTALHNFALKRGYSEQELQQAGLSSQAYRGGRQDMFRGRLMIPLQDPQGRVIGFTARLLESSHEGRAPKYINTPQTVLYDKSRHIYGLHLAKEAIRKQKYVVIVEGNLDVISSHQAGVAQVVATAGTALTEPHLKNLSRLSGDIRLCFDADRAGLDATERAIPLASRINVSLSIITLPAAKDPDELIRQSQKQWADAVMNHKYALDWLIARYEQELDLNSGPGKRAFSDRLLPIIRNLADPVEQDHYLGQIAERLQVSRGALDQKYHKNSGSSSPQRHLPKRPVVDLDRNVVARQKLQDRFLALTLMRPTLRELLDLVTVDMLYVDQARELLSFLKQHPDAKATQLQGVQNIGDYVKIESLLYEELYQDLELNELHDEATRLQAELITKYIKTQKQNLSQKQREVTDEHILNDLREQDKQYNELLNKVKGTMHG